MTLTKRSALKSAAAALLSYTALGALPAAVAATADATAPRKVLQIAFRSAETGFDPARLSDLYSRTVTPHIFEALYQYDHLARPIKIKPLTAAGMPEVSADFKVWTVRVKPGIYFADDPAFKGQKRELVARDFAYVYMRAADPTVRSELWPGIEETEFTGLNALHQEFLDSKKPFDYDRPVEGLRVIDRYTLQFRLDKPNPRLLEGLASSDLLGAVAREVVEFYGDKIPEHPVGTGPFRLKQWRRSSLIVLERNPDYREVLYDAQPAPDDADGQAILARLKGRRLPIVDEVRVSIINEEQPIWLSFLNGELDLLGTQSAPVPSSYAPQAMPGGKVAPNLAKKGIVGRQTLNADIAIEYFNMEDPVVGGYTPEKVALRRAIALAYDVEREIRIVRRGQAIPAQSQIVPNTTGYDPKFKSEAGDFDPARANALLDMYGYLDRDGDGWRELPDGAPLVLVHATQPEQIYREYNELWRKNLAAIRIRTTFDIKQWPEQLKRARAGKLQIWSLGSSAAGQDGQGALARLYGPQAGSQNLARFKNQRMDAIYDRMTVLPDGPEREALFLEAKKIATVYMPYIPTVHRIGTDMWYPWVIGFRRPVFWNEWWHLVDIDADMKAKALQ
ncbi:MAG: ABC transporter substrate-binding protein [Rubrivivax sp.]